MVQLRPNIVLLRGQIKDHRRDNFDPDGGGGTAGKEHLHIVSVFGVFLVFPPVCAFSELLYIVGEKKDKKNAERKREWCIAEQGYGNKLNKRTQKQHTMEMDKYA